MGYASVVLQVPEAAFKSMTFIFVKLSPGSCGLNLYEGFMNSPHRAGFCKYIPSEAMNLSGVSKHCQGLCSQNVYFADTHIYHIICLICSTISIIYIILYVCVLYIYTHIITYAITQYNARIVIQSVKLEIDPSDPVKSERR